MIDLCNWKDDKGQAGPSSSVLHLEIQYFSFGAALILGSHGETKATTAKGEGNKPT